MQNNNNHHRPLNVLPIHQLPQQLPPIHPEAIAIQVPWMIDTNSNNNQANNNMNQTNNNAIFSLLKLLHIQMLNVFPPPPPPPPIPQKPKECFVCGDNLLLSMGGMYQCTSPFHTTIKKGPLSFITQSCELVPPPENTVNNSLAMCIPCLKLWYTKNLVKGTEHLMCPFQTDLDFVAGKNLSLCLRRPNADLMKVLRISIAFQLENDDKLWRLSSYRNPGFGSFMSEWFRVDCRQCSNVMVMSRHLYEDGIVPIRIRCDKCDRTFCTGCFDLFWSDGTSNTQGTKKRMKPNHNYTAEIKNDNEHKNQINERKHDQGKNNDDTTLYENISEVSESSDSFVPTPTSHTTVNTHYDKKRKSLELSLEAQDRASHEKHKNHLHERWHPFDLQRLGVLGNHVNLLGWSGPDEKDSLWSRSELRFQRYYMFAILQMNLTACPKCQQRAIKPASTCTHMTCENCKIQFCFCCRGILMPNPLMYQRMESLIQEDRYYDRCSTKQVKETTENESFVLPKTTGNESKKVNKSTSDNNNNNNNIFKIVPSPYYTNNRRLADLLISENRIHIKKEGDLVNIIQFRPYNLTSDPIESFSTDLHNIWFNNYLHYRPKVVNPIVSDETLDINSFQTNENPEYKRQAASTAVPTPTIPIVVMVKPQIHQNSNQIHHVTDTKDTKDAKYTKTQTTTIPNTQRLDTGGNEDGNETNSALPIRPFDVGRIFNKSSLHLRSCPFHMSDLHSYFAETIDSNSIIDSDATYENGKATYENKIHSNAQEMSETKEGSKREMNREPLGWKGLAYNNDKFLKFWFEPKEMSILKTRYKLKSEELDLLFPSKEETVLDELMTTQFEILRLHIALQDFKAIIGVPLFNFAASILLKDVDNKSYPTHCVSALDRVLMRCAIVSFGIVG